MPLEMEVDTSEFGVLINDLKKYQVRARIEVGRTLNRHASKLRTEIVRRASGRPGPRQQTGRYVSSIQTRRGRGSADTQSVYAYTNHPAAHRLEYGFVGMDRLGRMYNQPPYPHFRPAIDATQEELIRNLRKAVIKTWLSRG